MGSNVIVDNWQLSDINDIFNGDIEYDNSAYINISQDKSSFNWIQIPYVIMQIESFFNILVDIITRESLFYDNNFAITWINKNDIFMELYHKEILKELKDDSLIFNKIKYPQEDILKELLINRDLEEFQKENEMYYEKYKFSKHEIFSQIVCGSAGYLAKSRFYDENYTPHPLRKKFLNQVLKTRDTDIIKVALDNINQNRKMINENFTKISRIYMPNVRLSPFIIEIIESSKTLYEIIPVTLQLRKQYKAFRGHLYKYQMAIEEMDLKKIAEVTDILRELSLQNENAYSDTTISLGYGALYATIPINKCISKILPHKNFKTSLQKIIFKKGGKDTLLKFLRMIDITNQDIQDNVLKYFNEVF